MAGSSDSQYLTASTTLTEYATTSFLPLSDPAHSGSTMERIESGRCTSVEAQIERSKCHWSKVVKSDSSITDEDEVADNVEVFKTLQSHPEWGDFFKTFGYDFGICESEGELEVGEKFAEGGQAKLYTAQVKWRDPKYNEYHQKLGYEWVLKVFKKGTLLRHLQSQWPHGFLDFISEELAQNYQNIRYFCDVNCGTLLEDGRFAFLMIREHEDLRCLINRSKLEIGEDQGLFSKENIECIIYAIARGMDWLHSRNIVHRDLKASNVLCKDSGEGWNLIYVADYECSVGVIGTGFWRAPEILQAIKDKKIYQRPNVFSKEADVYAYGMTCYEILTGKLPFEGHSLQDYDVVLNGGRPKVPEYVNGWISELLSRCWKHNPLDRPSFAERLDLLAGNLASHKQVVESERIRNEQLE